MRVSVRSFACVCTPCATAHRYSPSVTLVPSFISIFSLFPPAGSHSRSHSFPLVALILSHSRVLSLDFCLAESASRPIRSCRYSRYQECRFIYIYLYIYNIYIYKYVYTINYERNRFEMVISSGLYGYLRIHVCMCVCVNARARSGAACMSGYEYLHCSLTLQIYDRRIRFLQYYAV